MQIPSNSGKVGYLVDIVLRVVEVGVAVHLQRLPCVGVAEVELVGLLWFQMDVARLVGVIVNEVDVGVQLRIGGTRNAARQSDRKLPRVADVIVQHQIGCHEIAVAGFVQMVFVIAKRRAAVLESQSGLHRQLLRELRRIHDVGGRDILAMTQVVAKRNR